MGRKNSTHSQASEVEDIEEEVHLDPIQLTIEEEIEKKIKELPTLKEKVQAIALNHHTIQKRQIDKDLGSEITKLEVEFRKRYAPLLEEINNIIAGTHAYSDADFEGNTIFTEDETKVKHNYYKNEQFSEYWFKALISNDVVGEEVRQIDEALIKHLTKIQAIKESENNLKIVFTFTENEWFTNTTLTKEFELAGDEIKRSFGDQINWKEGKNITIKNIKKKGKNKKKTVQKQVESFFNFFKEIDLTEDSQEEKEEAEQQNDEEEEEEITKLERQYEIANEFYENLIPRSLEYFLGVVGADFGDLAGMEGLQGIEEDDEEEQQVQAPKKKGKGKRKGSSASGKEE